jgi:fructose-1,6-bisphosphatase
VAKTVEALAQAGIALSELIGRGRLAGDLNAEIGANADSDLQRILDLEANEIVLDALRGAPVAAFASEEMDDAVLLDSTAPLAVAIDPLDGSSNIETTAPIGTIFSILPQPDGDASPFMQPGSAQLAADFLLYGSSTTLALTLGEGTQIFTLDRRRGEFVVTDPNAVVPQGCREYAINGSNYRFWDEPVRACVDDCVTGGDGPMGLDHNTRWLASLVAEAFRILRRGGSLHSTPAARARQHPQQPPAPRLRGQSDRLPDGAGGRRGDERRRAHPRSSARHAAWARAARVRLSRPGRARFALPHRALRRRRPIAAVQPPQPPAGLSLVPCRRHTRSSP